MINVKNLQKSYDAFQALKSINFTVNKGEILALLGPNGAGKTTTMKIMTGFLPADGGKVEIDGETLNEESALQIQNRIGYLPENAPLYPDLNVYEHLDFSATVHGVPKDQKEKAICRVVGACGLEEKLYFNISELSKGYKQRVGLAQALIHDPEILILDEPTTGLDPNQIVDIRSFIESMRKEKTIILSTHIMQEVEAIADRVVVINQGEVVAEGTPESLMRGKSSSHMTRITVRGCPVSAQKTIEKVPNLENLQKENTPHAEVIIFTAHTSEDRRADIAREIIRAELELLEMITEKQRMEDVFQELTK